MILATDLDGTFLGGRHEGREKLYRIVRETEGATLVFVTGRGIGKILPLLEDPTVPTPDYIIADVGATIVEGPNLAPIHSIQDPIERRWPGADRVRAVLSRFPYLTPQNVPQERRVSWYLPGGVIRAELREAVDAELGCDLLISAGLYLDVLPRGVSKGSTLLSLIEWSGLPRERVVTAGDTLNDLSLFVHGLKGIVVGGAEPALRARAGEIGGACYLAEGPGCDGILEGLMHHELLTPAPPRQPEERPPEDTRPAETRQLIMVYHRLPFDETRRGDQIVRRAPKSPNGIIPTLLGFFENGREGLWIAWSKQEERSPSDFERRVPVDPKRYENLTAIRVPLTSSDVNRFYEIFSKEALWPVIFSFPERAMFDNGHWEHFLEINRLFAEETARVAEPGALVWVHDYNLWLVPRFLRELRPDVTIAFFHHTAFPPPDIFNLLPWRSEIIESLISCDYVGFHIPRYVENFVDVVRTHAPSEIVRRVPCIPRFLSYGCALGIDEVTREIEVGGRTVRTGAHPVGINVRAIHEILERPGTVALMDRVRDELMGRTTIFSVERLDYVKGPLEKMRSFELLLEEHPELHGKVVLYSVFTPQAPGMTAYQTTREAVDQAVGRVNGRFARIDWTPVRYFYRSLPYEDVIAHYAVADVAWITPLRDGLNLVAKEYVAANHASGGAGALVLSEFAGAAAELHGALLTNPYDPRQMAEDLYDALTLPEAERRARMATMYDIVDANNIDYWGYEFLAAVNGNL